MFPTFDTLSVCSENPRRTFAYMRTLPTLCLFFFPGNQILFPRSSTLSAMFSERKRNLPPERKSSKVNFQNLPLLCMSLSSDYEKARLMERNFQSFIDIRNSSLLSVRFIRSWMEFMASIEFMSAIYLRRIHIRSSVVRS